RVINHICDAAMLAAYGAGVSGISREMAAEVTRTTGPRERAIDTREVGIDTPDRVAAGLTGTGRPHGPTEQVVAGLTGTTQPFVAAEQTPSRATSAETTGMTGSSRETLTSVSNTEGDDQGAPDLPVTGSTLDQITTGRGFDGIAPTGDMQEMPPSPVESFSANGEELLNRLEWALARAERMNAETETSIARFAALEKHLNSLSDGGERLIRNLTDTVQRATESSDSMQKRSERILGQVEDRMRTVEAQMSRTAEVSSDVDEQARRIERTCEHADEVESRLKSMAERLADKADEVQERVALLMSGLRSGGEAQDRLTGLLQQASSLTSQVDHRIDALRATLADTKDEADRFRESFTDSVLRDSRQKLQEQLDTCLREQHEVVEAALPGHRAKLQEMIDLSASKIRAVDEATTVNRRQVDEMLQAIDNKIDGYRQRLDALQQREGKVESSLAAITDGLAGVSGRAAELDKTVDGLEASVDLLAGRAETAKTGLTNVILQGDKLLLDAHAACGQIEAGQRTAGTMLAEVGGACERVHALRDQAMQCQEVVTRLSSGRTEGETTTKQLEETIASARSLLEAVQRAVEKADEKCGHLDLQSTSTTELVDRLSQANVTGRTTVEQLNESVCNAEKASENTIEQLTRLTGAQGASANAAGQLDELVTTANQLHEAMQGLVAHADEKIGQLNSHRAAATSVLRNLSEANVNSTSLLERVNESKDKFELMAENAKKHMGQLLQDVSSLTARAEVNAKELKARKTAAAELIDRLHTASTPAEETATQLAQFVDQAKQYLTGMAEQCDQAGELTERLNAVTHLLPSATEAGASVEKATEEARSMHDRLVASADTARHHVTTLQELNDCAYGLIETHEQVKGEAETSTERLSTQLTATEKMLETARPLLDQFVGQARGLREKLRDLEGNTVRIEQTIGKAMARPMDIMAGAQAEAAQLERVCEAVRKVFTGLSQASLEAKKRTAECTQVTQQTTKRLSQLAQLTTQTDRAANTLNQWVEEALRAQSRLEKTLDNCPSIRETHPGDAIQRMSRITGPAGRIANASAIGQLEMLNEPGATEPSPQEGTTKSPARADEISQLIEDAKQAVAEAKG
ncbi:MAG: hypothetical protein JSU86_19390, partial [Phycisphaerales bacterium]